ncbi:MAG: SpoIIE family protein phosphatase [Flavobacteriales bacterium]|nr:SpoIIE family protein phosphatase [Flavobacteriales bacterium]
MKLRTAFRIYLVVYGGLIALSAYLIGYNYDHQLQQAEESTLSKLYGIASTLSEQVDRDAVEGVLKEFPPNGDTAGLSLNGVYGMYRQLFQRAVESNRLKTPIYTLTYDSATSRFLGGISSSGGAAYGWHYQSPPSRLKDIYHTGGTIPQFQDDHGTWLSAVCPLKNSEGKVFAVIEADYPFDSFLQEARNELVRNVLVSVLVMLLIGAIIYPMLNQILSAEEQSRQALEQASSEIHAQNTEIVSSLEYASTIQEVMLPTRSELNSFFKECLVFNRPRDIVSGDFYWFHRFDADRALIAVADCTGHGVPGALMSIVGHSYLNEVVIEQNVQSPSEILELLNTKIEMTFAGNGSTVKDGTDGMDVGICLVNKKLSQVTFSGARRPLTVINTGNSKQIPGTRRGIGEHYLSTDVPFENITIDLDPNDTMYLCTDGLQDQFGGKDARKLMRKRVISWLQELEKIPQDLREDWIQTRFEEWKGANAQVDDVCVVGFTV